MIQTEKYGFWYVNNKKYLNTLKNYFLINNGAYLRETAGIQGTSCTPESLFTSLAAANKKSLDLFTYIMIQFPTGSLWLR